MYDVLQNTSHDTANGLSILLHPYLQDVPWWLPCIHLPLAWRRHPWLMDRSASHSGRVQQTTESNGAEQPLILLLNRYSSSPVWVGMSEILLSKLSCCESSEVSIKWRFVFACVIVQCDSGSSHWNLLPFSPPVVLLSHLPGLRDHSGKVDRGGEWSRGFFGQARSSVCNFYPHSID